MASTAGLETCRREGRGVGRLGERSAGVRVEQRGRERETDQAGSGKKKTWSRLQRGTAGSAWEGKRPESHRTDFFLLKRSIRSDVRRRERDQGGLKGQETGLEACGVTRKNFRKTLGFPKNEGGPMKPWARRSHARPRPPI